MYFIIEIIFRIFVFIYLSYAYYDYICCNMKYLQLSYFLLMLSVSYRDKKSKRLKRLVYI